MYGCFMLIYLRKVIKCMHHSFRNYMHIVQYIITNLSSNGGYVTRISKNL